MKACPRCGFLNPDKGEFCIKCRCVMPVAGTKEAERATTRPARNPFAAEKGPTAAAPQAPGGAPAREEQKLGVGGFDEPPEWAHKPNLTAPTPDIDDVFAGRGLDVGGYQIGGHDPSRPPSTVAPGDAFAIMTGGQAMSGSESVARGKKRRKGRSRERELPPPEAGADPGALNGLPPDLTANPFGLPEDTMRGASPPPGAQQRGGPPGGPARGAQPLQQPGAPKFRLQGEAAPPAGPRFRLQGEAAPPGAPGYGPPGRSAPDAPKFRLQGEAGGASAPPHGYRQGQPAPAPRGMPGPMPPAMGVPQGGSPRVRRPVPSAGMPGPAPRAAARPKLDLPRPNLAVLSGVFKKVTPRVVVGAVGGILVFLALIYMVAGGGFFSSDAMGLVENSHKAMSALSSVRIQAEILMQTEKAGTVATAATIDLARDKDFHAVFGEAVYRPGTEYIVTGGKAYVLKEGAWQSADGEYPDFSSGALFAGLSGARLIDKQTMDGVECDHVVFESGPRFASSLFPGVDVLESTQVTVEAWIDPGQKLVRHLRLDATNLETSKLGRFNCHVEATLSGFGAPMEIKPPS